MRWVAKMRKYTDHYLLMLPLPRVSPNAISGMSVFLSFVFLFLARFERHLLALITLVVILLLDWFDGLIAQKYGLSSEEGYVCDIAADRLSEGLILIPFFMPWFFIYAIGMFTTWISIKYHVHIMLPLRQAFAIYYLVAFVL
jgi:phosphatidylglycerophosphate synthase